MLLDQLLRTAAGAREMARHAVRSASVETGISWFEAAAPNVYRLMLAHLGSRARWTTLLVDIYAVDRDGNEGHYAYFRKDLWLPPRASLAIEIRYDWDKTATIRLGGVDLEPDVLWRGTCGGAGDYFVAAVLSTREGEPIERLTLRQRRSS